MTPCEQLGWQIGDRFHLLPAEEYDTFAANLRLRFKRLPDVLIEFVLYEDDNTDMPWFTLYMNGTQVAKRICCKLNRLTKIGTGQPWGQIHCSIDELEVPETEEIETKKEPVDIMDTIRSFCR